MHKHILIPTDGSELAETAVDAGTRYAQATGAKVLFFTAVPTYRLPSEVDRYALAAAEILGRAAQKATEANIAFGCDALTHSDIPTLVSR
jgi:nucleotide-binding universal stress UspA family protein